MTVTLYTRTKGDRRYKPVNKRKLYPRGELQGQGEASPVPDTLKAQHPALRVFTSAHPSPLVRAKFPEQ
jgi:hypothetical protein